MKNRTQRQSFLEPSKRAAQEKLDRYNRDRRENPGKYLYNSKAWKVLRLQVLEDEPVCACGARTTVVDHIKAHRGDSALFFERRNLQGQCKTCHDRKTVRYDGGLGRERVEVDVPDEREDYEFHDYPIV